MTRNRRKRILRLARRPGQKRKHTPGTPPGTLHPPALAAQTTIDVIAYGPDSLQEHRNCDLKTALQVRNHHPVVWINVVGLADTQTIQDLGKAFQLHSLALEDVVSLGQRPKLEQYQHHTFVVLHAPSQSDDTEFEQYSIFIGEGFVITIQERAGDCLGPLRDRIRHESGRVRQKPSDYLAYAIIDTVVDHFFPRAERYLEQVDSMESQVTAAEQEINIADLHHVRHHLLNLQLLLWPMREVARSLSNQDSRIFSQETRYFLRDTYDHTLQLSDMVESCRSSAAELMELHLSQINARMSEVMKVLTLIATIFMPLSFVAGLYGMNFDRSFPANMPELSSPYGYPVVVMIMMSIAVGLLIFFYRKGWIGRIRPRQ